MDRDYCPSPENMRKVSERGQRPAHSHGCTFQLQLPLCACRHILLLVLEANRRERMRPIFRIHRYENDMPHGSQH